MLFKSYIGYANRVRPVRITVFNFSFLDKT